MLHLLPKIWAALRGLQSESHRNTFNHHQFNQLMSALDNINTSLNTLAGSIDAAVAVLSTPAPAGGATEAQVQAVADTIASQAARLSAALPVTQSTGQ